MGDASQTGNANKSRFRSQLIVEGQQTKEINSPDTPEGERLSVLYTHGDSDSSPTHVQTAHMVCRSLEELLTYLESDLVESLWFDESVTAQERSYITGWARIFRPSLTAQRLQERIAN